MNNFTNRDKDDILDELMRKIVNEMNEFVNSITNKTGRQMMEEMIPYELIYKEDIMMSFEYDELDLSKEELVFLLDLECPLEWLYQEWLKYDGSHMDMLREFIKNTLDRRTR